MIRELIQHLRRYTNRSLHTRFMVQVILIVVVAFVLLAAIVISIQRRQARGQLAHTYETALNQLYSRITDQLDRVTTDLSDLSATVITQLEESGAPADDFQQIAAIVAHFNSLAKQNAGYTSIRYVTDDGSVVGQVFTENGITLDFHNYPQRLQQDPGFQRGLSAQVGEVVIGSYSLKTDTAGVPLDPPVPLISFFVPIAVDTTGGGKTFYIQIEASADLFLNEVNQAFLNVVERLDGRHIILMDEQGQVVADSGAPAASNIELPGIASEALPYKGLYDDLRRIEIRSGIIQQHHDDYVVSVREIRLDNRDASSWMLLFVDRAQTVYASTNLAVTLIAGGLAVAAAVVIALINFRLRTILQPLATASDAARRITQRAGVLEEAQPASSAVVEDDMVHLLRSFDTIEKRIQDLTTDFERQVARRTRDLEVAARIGREVATVHDLDSLLNRAIDLICRELGYYHAQVFLIDDIGSHAVLAYSRGEAGRKLLEQNHKIAIGAKGVIGQVTATGLPVLVNDTTKPGEFHSFNPLLPDTRAELGLPLSIGENIIGALDIQSRQASSFREGDLPTFRLLADQLAIAVYNTRLIVQSEKRIEQITALDRQLTRGAWQKAEERYGVQQAYQYNLLTTKKIEPDAVEKESGGLIAPLSVHGVVVGSIAAGVPEGEAYTEDDQVLLSAIAERVSYAIENARLFQETQLGLAETSTLYQLSQSLNEAVTLEDVIRAIIGTVLSGAVGGQIWIFSDESDEFRTWIELVTLVNIGDAPVSSEEYMGMRLWMADYPLLDQLDAEQVIFIPDIAVDERVAGRLREIFQRLSMRALAIIPLSMRGVWRGIMTVGFPESRQFSEHDRRVYHALIDQAGVAVDNRLLLQQTEEALARNETLYAASRMINTAQTFSDLVYALVATSDNPSLSFWLAMLEGERDENNWPARARILAQSDKGIVSEANEVIELSVAADSPLRHRDPEIYIDSYVSDVDEHPHISWMRERGVRFLVIFPLFSANQPIAMFGIVSASVQDLSTEDYEVYRALTGQITIQLENRRLFETVEGERKTLSSILSAMPSGVLVLDSKTYRPVIHNEKASELLGRQINSDEPFSAETFGLYRTGTDMYYPNEELPVFAALNSGEPMFGDDVALITEQTHTDLLVNAAPIRDAKGDITAIVAAFEDISNLRRLENTLQENLRETVALYEAQRAFSEAESLDDVLDVIVAQLTLVQPSDAYIALFNEELGEARVARELFKAPEGLQHLDDILISGDVLVIYDTREHVGLSAETSNVLEKAGIRSLIVVPMRVRTRSVPMGWMIVVDEMPLAFSPDQERMLTTLSDVAATALDNRFLFQNTQVAYQETAALYNATTAVSRSSELNQITQAVKTALEALNPDYYAAYVINGSDLIQLFDIARSGNPVDFHTLLYHTLPDERGIYIDDIAAYPANDFVIGIRALGNIQALGAVNLRIKDAPGGRLFVGYENPRRFNEASIRYLNALADSASLRVDNILLFEQIQATLEETSTLYQASRVLSDATSPEEILNVVVDYLIGPHVNQVFVGLLSTRTWDTPGATFQIVASWNTTDSVSLEGVALAQEQFPAWFKLSTPTVLMVGDIEQDDQFSPMERIGVESLGARSVVIIPLRMAQRSIGAIWMGSDQPYQYTDRELRIYQAFAEQASLSMEASHLLGQAERRATQLETSAIIGETVNQILDIALLLPRVVNLIRDAFEYDHAQVFLMDEEDDWAVLQASTGEAGQKMLQAKHKLQKGSESIIGQVTLTGKPVVALDTADATVVHKPNPYLPLTRSEMALPLIIKDKVVGALDLQSNKPNAFSDEDVRVLAILAGQISVALENANLYKETQSRANEMGFLFEVTTEAAAAMTLSETLQNVADHLYAAMQPLSVTIYAPQLYTDGSDDIYTVMQAVALAGTDQPLSEVSEVRLDDENNLIGIVGYAQQPMLIPNIEEERRYLPVAPEARSAIIVPFVSSGELIGLIIVEDEKPSAYDEDTLRLLQTLSGSVSAVIRSAQLLEQLTNANEDLRELDRLKSDFLANMSHELRTPLNSIIGFSRVMLKGIDGPLTEMQEQDLTTIYNSGQHLLMLINDVLDQAKIASGKMDMKMSFFEVKPLVEGVRSIGIGLVKDKPIDLFVELAPNLPQVFGDEFRTRQVLLNLVSNAAKFTREGSVTIRVYPEVDRAINKLFVRIDVIDTGIGVLEKDMPLLFEAFRQVDSSLTRTVGGTGLGLPIAKSLVEMQGGQMMVSSQVGTGSTFSFTLSTEQVELPEEEEEDRKTSEGQPIHHQKPSKEPTDPNKKAVAVKPVAPSGPSHKVMNTKRQILLIEDNPDVVDQFRRILQREGFEIFTATIPLEAEAMASGLHPTVVVMDVNFSQGKGWNILKSIKERDDTYDIPVVIATLSGEAEKAIQSGAFRFVQRPFSPEQLAEAVLAAEAESRTERILIIDDQPESVRLLKQVLDRHGQYRIFSAHNGVEGISLVARRRPDLILLDLRMPDMDGFAVLEELRANPETATIPVMVITSDHISAEEQQRLENVSIIQKTDISPDNSHQFIDRVQAQLAGVNGGSE